jgi:Zn-dependent protease
MSWLRDPRIVLMQRPVAVTIGRGGFMPIIALGLLFAGFAARVGLPVVGAGVFGALAGTASLIAHELGHVRAALRLSEPRPVGVSLICLGAATRLEGTYATGGDQARVAAAGPRASFAVAISLVPLLAAPIPVDLKALVFTLAALNIAIGVLSIIPVKPLDGYKLIVGLLWSWLGSKTAAQRIVRRLAFSWAAVELVGAGVLLVEKPLLGAVVGTMAASLYVRKLFARVRA